MLKRGTELLGELQKNMTPEEVVSQVGVLRVPCFFSVSCLLFAADWIEFGGCALVALHSVALHCCCVVASYWSIPVPRRPSCPACVLLTQCWGAEQAAVFGREDAREIHQPGLFRVSEFAGMPSSCVREAI